MERGKNGLALHTEVWFFHRFWVRDFFFFPEILKKLKTIVPRKKMHKGISLQKCVYKFGEITDALIQTHGLQVKIL